MDSVVVIYFLFFLMIYYFMNRNKKYYNFPPGPKGIPLLGSVFYVGASSHETFREWAKVYGPLIKTKFGVTDVLIIDDAKLIREALNMPAMSGKPGHKVFTVRSGGKHGITNADGQEWFEQSRFVLKTLKNLGFGKNFMENLILVEVRDFLQWVKKNEGVPIAVNDRLVTAVVNSLWCLVAGERHAQDDEELKQIVLDSNQFTERLGQSHSILFLFPKLIDILPKFFLPAWYRGVETLRPFGKIFLSAIENHLQNNNENDPSDLIDMYLKEIKNTTDTMSTFYKTRGYKTLEAVLNDLYEAGQVPTYGTLTWAVLYLVRFPEIQAKIHNELDLQIGRNRMPSLSDRDKVPYTEAFILETLRYSSIAPLGKFHEVMQDTKIAGYDVKKGTTVMANTYSVHFNENLWGDPEKFRPERFLTSDEQKITKTELINFMAFGYGKRRCIGERFAKDNIFLFLTSLLQQFEISPDPSNPTPTLDATPGFLRKPKQFLAVLKERPSV